MTGVCCRHCRGGGSCSGGRTRRGGGDGIMVWVVELVEAVQGDGTHAAQPQSGQGAVAVGVRYAAAAATAAAATTCGAGASGCSGQGAGVARGVARAEERKHGLWEEATGRTHTHTHTHTR